ncbi:hypothetical protein [Sorangium sp. So ce117]|uniref:hypothetical protein n=1 Tax=Sorangium sp. So ce117 TaxID=3133277 RepID=UPI003F646F02
MDDGATLAAANALEHITGAGMCKDAAVEDGEIFVSDPPAPDVGEAREPKLAPLVSDPRCRFPPDRRTVHGE